ncbi:MAG: hypothetical protein JXJ22_07795 [Bacteroidales bacterium]|nr:hypothetical protein [Bacteroidales bacterium]
MRKETDFIGTIEIPQSSLFGIHSVRAQNNFPDKSPFLIEWYKAVGSVKKACYLTAEIFFREVETNYPDKSLPLRQIDEKILESLILSAEDVETGKWFDHFIVPAIQGGAGTSINMNINEIIANASLLKMNKQPGDYHFIDPVEHANIFQSTNDVIPTSLKLATIRLLTELEESINRLRQSVEKLEGNYRNILRIGYTQMQEAVPTSYGRLFGSYSEALSRDWWRVSKCFERIKVVNLGGSAIGTGITVPRYFIMNVVPALQKITDLPLTRGENLADITSNLDAFVEVHAILKTHAVNLEKMVNDLRLLSSDLVQPGELKIPQKQVGSSIMPGKVNPVIPEFVISAAHKIYTNDTLITSLCAQGCLELNAYIPVIGHALLESIKLLIACNFTIYENLLSGIVISESTAANNLLGSPVLTTSLLPYIGYHKASEMARLMKEKKIDIFAANKELNYIPEAKLKKILEPQQLLSGGFSVQDILQNDE